MLEESSAFSGMLCLVLDHTAKLFLSKCEVFVHLGLRLVATKFQGPGVADGGWDRSKIRPQSSETSGSVSRRLLLFLQLRWFLFGFL